MTTISRHSACIALLLSLNACGEPASPSHEGGDQPDATADVVPSREVASAVAATPSPADLAEPTWFYRIDLARDAAGTLSLREVSAVKSGIRPTPGFQGDYWAVGYAGDAATKASPLFFPTEGQLSTADEDGNISHTVAALIDSTASVFVEATGIDRVTIMSGNGVDVLEIPQASLPPLGSSSKVRRTEPIGSDQQALGLSELRERYPQIRFLTAGDEPELSSFMLGGGEVLAPSPAETQVLGTALGKLPPALLATIQTLAILRWPEGSRNAGSNGITEGATVALNTDAMLSTAGDDPNTMGSGMMRTIVHEAVHTFQFLQDAVATNADTSEWRVDVERAAAEIVEQYRLTLGVIPVWDAIQQSGVEQQVAEYWLGDQWKLLLEEEARAMGFATKKGSESASEDFAETAATAIVRPTQRGICHNFEGRTEVSREIAIPYAKLVVVASLGAITEADFSSCVGSVEFKTQPGIEMNGFLFDQNNKAQTIEIDGAPYFAVYGEGPNTYQLLIRISLPTFTTSPIGLHRLDTLTLTQVGATGRSEVLLGNSDERLNRGTAYGLVLVTEDSQAQSRGAILGLILHNGFGEYTDYVPFGTFQIYH